MIDAGRRIVITGLGLITPIGTGKEAYYRALKEGDSGGKRLDQVTDEGGTYPLELEDVPTKVGAPVLDFDPTVYMGDKKASRLTRASQFSLAASRLALEDAGIGIVSSEEDDRFRLSGIDRDQVGVLMGTGIGGIESFEHNYSRFLSGGPRKVSPFFTPQMMPNSTSGVIAIEYGLRGFSTTNVSACASSTHAIGLASTLLRDGRGRMALAGGTEAVLTPLILAAFAKAKATTRRNDFPLTASRPFDLTRDGFLPAEGAGVVVLETLEAARERGASIYAEIRGFGMSEDATHITAPDPEGQGAFLSMSRALDRACLAPEDVDYVNAHGTSTPLNDAMETRAIKQLFGERAAAVAISSTKSQLGHLMGAAGVVEVAACTFALEQNLIPATINYEESDPDCDLNYTPNKPQEKKVEIALTNSFGFGGHNGTVCLSRLKEV
ncbi:MAG: beta-ketoacyl-ACP synthase II [Candidatus Bipolaricaulota bacterium]